MLAQSDTDKTISAPDWEKEAKGLLKAELVRCGVSHQKLAALLSELGVDASKASIDSKLSRGTFSAAFLVQCLRAIGCYTLKVGPE
jgi:hypothetical protein